MDWKALIDELTKAGLTQAQIADECGVKSQSTVSDLARGATKSPTYDFGKRLIELHRERVKESPTARDRRSSERRATPDRRKGEHAE
jgi:transcriptional regulator with XRE-family HTH domain